MKKRLLFAILFSMAAGGMLYQVSWSEVEAPGPVEDPQVRPPAYCAEFPEDPLCGIQQAPPPVEAPGQEVEPPEGLCVAFPADPRCVGVALPPVEVPE